MGLRATAEVIEGTAPIFRAAGVKRVEYAEDGTISSIDWYPREGDTEPAPPPPRSLREPVIPPPSPIPRECTSETRLTALDLRPPVDAHPETPVDGESVDDLVARELAWLASNGRTG